MSSWEKCIATEPDEKAQCDRCKLIVMAEKVGEQIFCHNCNKYVWRKK